MPGEVSIDNKGAANYSIPLQSPPGRANFQPKLSISYNSGSGNGPLGLGFSLATGFPQAISRGRSILARDGETRGVTFTSKDKFYLDGKRLICVSGTYGAPDSIYRTEVDSFVTIVAAGTGTDSSNWNIETFTMTDKSGTQMVFGKYADTTDGYQPGAYRTLAYTYALKRVTDALGNYIDFTYRPADSGEYLLDTIRYTGGSGIDPLAVVHLYYNERVVPGNETGNPFRIDSSVRYIGGHAFPMTSRLDRIEANQVDGGAETVAARYKLNYEYAPSFGPTRLISVASSFRDSTSGTLKDVRATSFEWSNHIASYTTKVLEPNDQVYGGFYDPKHPTRYTFGDLNGDGKDDMLEFGDGDSPRTYDCIKVYLSNGGELLAPQIWAANLSPYFSSDVTIPQFWKLADLNGDGKKDIVFGDYYAIWGLISTGSGFVGLNGGSEPTRICTLAGEFSPVETATENWEAEPLSPPEDYGYFGDEGTRVCTGDFTGDGRDDILIHRYDGKLEVLENNGTSFTKKIYDVGNQAVTTCGVYAYDNILNAPPIKEWRGYRNKPRSVQMMPCNLNNDGIMDYAWVETTQAMRYTFFVLGSMVQNLGLEFKYEKTFKVVLSQPGGGFSRAVEHHSNGPAEFNFLTEGQYGFPYRSTSFTVMPGDLNGDGLTDFFIQSIDSMSYASVDCPDALPDRQQYYISSWAFIAGDVSDPLSALGARQVIPPKKVELGSTQTQAYPWFDKVPYMNFEKFFSDSRLVFQPLDVRQTLWYLDRNDGADLADVNGDGRDDYVWFVVDGPQRGWWVMYALDGSFSEAQRADFLGWQAPQQLDSEWVSYRDVQTAERVAVDLNGDGVKDYAYSSHAANHSSIYQGFHISNGPTGNRITCVTNGLNHRTSVVYKPITNDSVYTVGAAVSYPIREQRNATYVVSDLYKESGSTTPAHFIYQYAGARTDLSGRGFLGFHSFVTLDTQTNLFKYQFLTQSFPMTGLTAREQTYRYWTSDSDAKFRLISTHDNTVVFDEVANGSSAYGTVYPFISKAVESRYEDSTTAHFTRSVATSSSQPESLFPAARPAGAHITITAESLFDGQETVQTTLPGDYKPSDRTTDWNLPGANTVVGSTNYADFEILDFPRKITYGNLKKLSTNFGDGFTETVTTNYKDPIGPLTGLVDSVSTKVTSSFGEEDAPIKSYTYHGTTPLVATETINAVGAGLDSTTTYNRDDTDRPWRVTKTEFTARKHPDDTAAETYTVSENTVFDNRFDLPTETKNAYSHKTTTTYHSLFAKPTSVTEVNEAQVTTTYDALGRILTVTDVLKGHVTTNTYSWDASQIVSGPTGEDGLSLPSVYAVSTITKSIDGAVTIKPAVTAYFDRLGRTIRTMKDGFNGQQAITDTVYNVLGQVIAVSNPYPANASDRYWTKTTYDPMGRVKTVTAPNGTVTTNAYHGRITQVTVDAPDRDPQVNSTYVDAKGRTIAVWNADNPVSAVTSPDSTSNTTWYVDDLSTASIAYGLDGFGRMRETRLKDQAQTITATYDALGRQLTLNDPDKGPWSYLNNAVGQVVRQEDAKHNVTTSTFDRLGRPLTRTTTGNGSTETAGFFYYDTTANVALYPHLVAKDSQGWIGAPQREECTAIGSFPAVNLHYYDAKGRPSLELAQSDGKWFYTAHEYDAYSRPASVRHFWKPAGAEDPDSQPYVWQDYGYTYSYDNKSYLTSLTDSLGRSWWDQPAYDYLDRIISVRKGASHVTTRTYRAEDGLLTAIATPSVQNMSFGYDGLGNLTSRSDTGVGENYGYDNLNRLEKRNGSTIAAYQPNGNITSKTEVGGQNVTINAYDSTHPHAVSSYTFNSQTTAITYDANGNLLTRIGGGTTWSMKWAGFDKPRWMAKTTATTTAGSEFHYNANRSRVIQCEFDSMTGAAPNQTPLHYNRKRLYALGSTLELNYANQNTDTNSSAQNWLLDTVRIYVPGPDGIIGAREFNPGAGTGQQEKAVVYHYDHLGSITATTLHGTGAIATDKGGKPGKFSEDAWGQRRNPFTWEGVPVSTGPNASDDGGADSVTPRGFTGHEMLDDLDFVHMNGRIYDPLLGRMLSADLVVQNPNSLQDYNRYSYVLNNPLKFTDPTGWEYYAEDAKSRQAGMAAAFQKMFVNLYYGMAKCAVGMTGPGPLPPSAYQGQMKVIEALDKEQKLVCDKVDRDTADRANNSGEPGNEVIPGSETFQDGERLLNIPMLASGAPELIEAITVKAATAPVLEANMVRAEASALTTTRGAKIAEGTGTTTADARITTAAVDAKPIKVNPVATGSLEGKTGYNVYRPNGQTITDIDSIKDGVLWEEKTAAWAGDNSKWVDKNIYGKFDKYMEARAAMPGYENAPIGFKFDGLPADNALKEAIEKAVQDLRSKNPNVDIRLDWGTN
ncbi:MAG: RHS repeat-associated core domain-containing protein [Nibricoccus sp.]